MDVDRIVNLDALIEEGYTYSAHLVSAMGAIDEVHFYKTMKECRAYFLKRLSALAETLEESDALTAEVYNAYDLKSKNYPRPVYAMYFDQAFLNN